MKKYHSELKRYIHDADQWLNKSNQQSKKTKYRITQIFKFFSQICQEKPDNGEEYDEEEDNDIKKSTSVQNETQIMETS